MNPSLSALIKACKKLGLAYQQVHKHDFAIKVLSKNGSEPLFFIHNKFPFNSASTARILDDKDLSYTILKNKVRLPIWKSYIDPKSDEGDKSLIEFSSLKMIAGDVKGRFKFPVIVKRNSGKKGVNVFICHSMKDIVQSLKEIFKKQSPFYDYLAIGQEYIESHTEIRAIATPDKLLLAYSRELDMSSLPEVVTAETWFDCVFKKIDDVRLLKKVERFLSPIFDLIPIGIVGADITIDGSGKMYLLELNHSPMFDFYIDYAGDEDIVEIYTHLLKAHCC